MVKNATAGEQEAEGRTTSECDKTTTPEEAKEPTRVEDVYAAIQNQMARKEKQIAQVAQIARLLKRISHFV
jgi:hypothetical protein